MAEPFSAVVARGQGRFYRSQRRVRLGDVTPGGALRLDAVARYFQDVATDDADDAGLNGDVAWLVRRSTLEVVQRPAYRDDVDLTTWCSGTGAAWAERRTTLAGHGGVQVEGSSLWVCMNPISVRPRALDDRFFGLYFDRAERRKVSGRLRLPALPPPGVPARRWPLRPSDFDLFGHVNNAVAWVALEAEVGAIWPGHAVVQAEVEYRRPVTGAALDVISFDQGDVIGVWLIDESGETAISAVLRSAPLPKS